MKLFDRVIISTDDYFLPFIPLVTKAWKKLWNCKITVAIVGDVTESLDMPYCDDVVGYNIILNIPIANQAKVLKCIAAMYPKYEDEVILLSDADLIPLARWYLEERLSARNPGELFITSCSQFYANETVKKFTSNNLTAEGYVWKEIYSPNYFNSLNDLYKSWYGMHVHDEKEDFFKSSFSHESQLRVLVNRWHGVQKWSEALVYPFTDRVIDRAKWVYDVKKLYSQYYYVAHCNRPYNQTELQPIIDYVESL